LSVCVVVPFRGGCAHREAAWAYLQVRYAEQHPSWHVVEAPAPDGAWSKGAAIASAIGSSEAEIVVQADADVWMDGVATAVEAVRDGAAWAIPHDFVHRLGDAGTAALISGSGWQRFPLAQKPYRGIEGGGAVIARRELLEEVPVDPRFIGWGQEDECQAMALRTLAGEAWRGSASMLHLWHPPQERMNRRRGSHESWRLRKRYFEAQGDPAAMAALIEEGRDARQAAEPDRLGDLAL
jgi:hypothetical protein